MKAFSLVAGLLVFTASASLLYAGAEDEYDSGAQFYNHDAFDVAERYFRRAVSERTNYWQAYEKLAYCYFYEKNFAAAAEAARQSLAIHPNNDELKQFVADHLEQTTDGSTETEPQKEPGSTASATVKPRMVKCDSAYLNLGLASPILPASSVQTSGFDLGAGYGFYLSDKLQLVVDVHYDDMPLDQSKDPSVVGGDFGVLSFMTNLKAKCVAGNNPVVPYLIGGFGPVIALAGNSTVGSTSIASTSTLYFGGRLGVGCDLWFTSSIAVFVEGNGIAFSTGSGSNNVIGYSSARIGLNMSVL